MDIYAKNQNLSLKKFLAKIVVLIFLIIFLSFFGDQIRNYFYFSSSAAASGLWEKGGGYSSFLSSLLSGDAVREKYDGLEKENQKLLSEISSLKKTLSENWAGGEIAKNTADNSFDTVLTNVIGLDIPNDFILINKGLNDGISENMPVISSQKILFGKVFKVYKNFSQVMLISNKNSVLDAKIQGDDPSKNPIHGVVRGTGDLSFYLDIVSPDSEIEKEDILITSGLEGIFPPNLLLGKIKSVDKNDLKPFQTAEIEPFFDAKNTENLFVAINYLQQ